MIIYKYLNLNEVKELLSMYKIEDEPIFYPDSEMGRNRLRIRSLLRKESTTQDIYFCLDEINHLRWLSIYIILFYFIPGKLIILDRSQILRVNFIYVLKVMLFSLISIILQVLEVLVCVCFISILSLIRRRFTKIRTRDFFDNAIYVRSTEDFNMHSGGGYGHTLGIFNALQKVMKTKFYGVSKFRSIDDDAQTIIPPFKYARFASVFNRFFWSLYLSLRLKIDNNLSENTLVYHRLSRDSVVSIVLRLISRAYIVLEYNGAISWEAKSNTHHFRFGTLQISILLEKLSLMFADKIVCVSDALKNELVAKQISVNKIIVQSNGVDTSIFRNKAASDHSIGSSLRKHSIKIGFSGSFAKWHGVDDLKFLVKNLNGVDVEFLFVGSGPELNKIKQLLPNDDVHIYGNIDYFEVPRVLASCDILLCCSKATNEEVFVGSPTKLFEYMSLGSIVIASDVGQQPDILSPFITVKQLELSVPEACGMIYSNNQELRTLVLSVVENKDRYASLATNAYAKASSMYTWDKILSNILQEITK